MSHTFQAKTKSDEGDRISFIHNGDFSGDVTISVFEEVSGVVKLKEQSSLPVEVLVEFVAKLVRSQKMTNLKTAGAREVLGIGKKV